MRTLAVLALALLPGCSLNTLTTPEGFRFVRVTVLTNQKIPRLDIERDYSTNGASSRFTGRLRDFSTDSAAPINAAGEAVGKGAAAFGKAAIGVP